MSQADNPSEHVMEIDVLVLGGGAAGCGAAIGAREAGAGVILLDKGKLESSGCLGGGNDHFMAVLNSGPCDTGEDVAKFYGGPLSGLTASMIIHGWVEIMPTMMNILEEIGVEFFRHEDGSYMRTPGFGQPGDWWINIKNGDSVKRRLAGKIRGMGIDVMDHVMATKLLKTGGAISGCVGYNVLDGRFYTIKAKKTVLALGKVANRAWTNSTGNPFNTWYSPYTTGGYFVMAYDAGVKLFNMDIGQMATLIPKGFGAPGMNGINSMGGRELNALGERFMGKYDPMWENGKRINQITGTYQELIEGKGPPFYIDMRHFDPKEVHHLQYVLMPGDKATYLDYCRQKGIDFGKVPLEVEISELAVSGMAKTDENFETNVSGLYNACLFQASSGALCGGYFAGTQAAKTARLVETFGDIDHGEAAMEKERISRPMQNTAGIHYKGFAGAIRQVMNYYVGYRRNQLGLEVALDRLAFIEGYADKIKAANFHELMRANESIELLRMCQIVVRACMERKESGRAMFRRTDYPEMNPALAKPLVVWQENGEPKFSWGV